MGENLKNRCQECGKQASFNFKGITTGVKCGKHKEPNMVDVKHPQCVADNCYLRPNYNYKNDKQGMYCKKHKLENMVDVTHNTCEFKNCPARPSYNYQGKKKGIYCDLHKLDHMVNVVTVKCLADNCNTHPTFNYKGKIKGIYCIRHKLDNMVNVKDRKCEFNGCNVIPTFNYKGCVKALFCSKHKLEDMVDVKMKLCFYKECNKRPSYNYRGYNKPLYCGVHKLPNMINIYNRKCLFKDCDTFPIYNFPSEIKGNYCFEHKLPNMIDVYNKICTVCETRAWYGFVGQKPIKCAKHKGANMMPNPCKTCSMTKCKEIATYGYRNNTHCGNHKINDMNHFVYTECKHCKELQLLNDDGYCETCIGPVKYNKFRLAKQREIKYWLVSNGYKYETYDKTINECVKYRPDFMFSCVGFKVFLEIDEDQHRNYEELCECVRMINIGQSLGGEPCIFIRYNPDEFMVGKKKHNPAFNTRIKALKSWLDHTLAKDIEAVAQLGFVSVLHLFYDEYDSITCNYKTVMEFET